MGKKILGIVGSYRKDGVIDTLVSAALDSAREQGAETEKIYLIDRHIEFCANCRSCTQQAGEAPGRCVIDDDMADILSRYAQADGLIFGAPVNFFNVNAVTRTFMERLVCFSYWPWGQPSPKPRKAFRGKYAVLITSSAMPSIMGRVFTGAMRALKMIAKVLGAKPVASIFVGLIAQNQQPELSEKTIAKARAAGRKLVQSCG